MDNTYALMLFVICAFAILCGLLFLLDFLHNRYHAVSYTHLRQVQIKESSVYYYFKSKQAIFDELLCLFENLSLIHIF